MTGNPAIRLLVLVKQNKIPICVGAVLSLIGTSISGLMTPKQYKSAAIVRIEPPSEGVTANVLGIGGNETDTAINNARLRATSTPVLREAAKVIIKEQVPSELAFPSNPQGTAIKYRLSLLMRAVKKFFGIHQPLITTPLSPDADPEYVADLIRQQMRVSLDSGNMTIAIEIESGTSQLAKHICEIVTEEFIAATSKSDRADLLKKESYIQKSIESQKQSLSLIEQELQEINRKYPEIALVNLDSATRQSIYADDFIGQKRELKKVATDLKTLKKLLSKYKKALKQPELNGKQDNMISRLNQELEKLEFKRLELIQVMDYPKNHPEIMTLNKRIARTTKLLKNLERESDKAKAKHLKISGGKNKSQVKAQISSITEEIQTLLVKQELLQASLKENGDEMQKGLAVESHAASLARNLSAHIDITRTLRRTLEEVRLQIFGSTNSASLLIPPSLSIHPTNISVVKRAFFGAVVGAGLVVCLLFLLDLLTPRLLLFEDLDYLNIHHFGLFKIRNDSMLDFTSALLTLKNTVEKKPDQASQVILFTNISVPINFESWVIEISQILRNAGYSAGIIIVSDKDTLIRRDSMSINGLETNWLHIEELSFTYESMVNDMKAKYDWILVLSDGLEQGPATIFLTRMADHMFYISKMGESELKEYQRIQKASSTEEIGEHALIFDH